jgi:archaellum biogenesis ATPase FlaH
MLLNSLLNSLITNHNYFGVVFPFLKSEYFSKKEDRIIVDAIIKYHMKYNKRPTFSNIRLLLDTDYDICQEDTVELFNHLEKIENIKAKDLPDTKVLIDQTELFFKDRALEKAINESIEIIEKKGNRGEIETKVKDALAIQFNIDIGHDYFHDGKIRLDSYMDIENKIRLDINNINIAMGGGLVRQGIFMYFGSTNAGKTTWLVHSASSLIQSGKNVLVLSGEMSVKEYYKRCDANILDIPISELTNTLDKTMYKSKFKSIFDKPHGELLIQYFRAGSMNANNIRSLLREIQIKKNLVFDVIILDHLTLFSSTRLPLSRTGDHMYYQCIVEEIRDIAVEFDCSILTGVQFNRGAKGKKENVSNEDVALGYGISQASDWSGALILTTELREQNKYLLKVMKTRYAANNEQIYGIGIDFQKMKLTQLKNENEDSIPLHIRDQIRYQQSLKDIEEETPILFDFSTE